MYLVYSAPCFAEPPPWIVPWASPLCTHTTPRCSGGGRISHGLHTSHRPAHSSHATMPSTSAQTALYCAPLAPYLPPYLPPYDCPCAPRAGASPPTTTRPPATAASGSRSPAMSSHLKGNKRNKGTRGHGDKGTRGQGEPPNDEMKYERQCE